jgi:hypothetical protein
MPWLPRLLAATPQQLAEYEPSAGGIHWDALDEDIAIEGLLAGQGDLTHHRRQVACAVISGRAAPYRQEGQANMLLSLLAVKFGPLGEADRRRVLDADAQTLLQWSTRLLSARTLEEVFGAGPRPDSEH